MPLNGKTILITGGAKRLGRALALHLAEEGATIAIHYHSSKKEADGLLRHLKSKGSEAAIFRADLRQVRQIETMVRKVVRRFGGVDVLINNASVFYATPFGKTSEKDWDLFMETNLKAPFFCSQAVARAQKGGALKIINILDSSGPKTRGNYLPYWISKTGLTAMTETLAKIFSSTKKEPIISINGIAPGPIFFPEDRKKFRNDITVDPSDIAAAVSYLVHGGNSITGNVLLLDKGRRYVL